METANYRRLERFGSIAVSLAAAAAAGWAIAIALGLWGDLRLSGRPYMKPWQPVPLPPLDLSLAPAANAPARAGATRLLGVAGERVYLSVGNELTSLGAGDRLPSGESIVRVTRSGIVVRPADANNANGTKRSEGGKTREISIYSERFDPSNWDKTASAAAAASTTAAPAASAVPTANNCRLNPADRASALYLDAAVIEALSAETNMLSRMFEALPGGGIRAVNTGGTTAMFAIQDGDILSSVDGASLSQADAIATVVLARLRSGQAVVIQGERSNTPQRWVMAPRSCAT